MDHFEQLILSIAQDSEYQEVLEDLDRTIKEDKSNNSKKDLSKALLEILNKIVSEKTYSPKTKFYAIMIAKDFSLKKYTTFLSCLSSSQLLQQMLRIALSTDPQKKMEDKGLGLFTDKALGNRYLTLILECIITWGNRHPNTSNGSKTRFKVAQNELLSAKVVLPSKFVYFVSTDSKINNKDSKPSKPEQKGGSSGHSQTPQGVKDEVGLQGALKLFLSQIDGYFMMLDQAKSEEELEESKKYHQQFVNDLKKLQSMEGELDKAGEQAMERYFIILEFFQKQIESYQKYAQHQDLHSYYAAMIQSNEQIRKLAESVGGASVSNARRVPADEVVYDNPRPTEAAPIAKKISEEQNRNNAQSLVRVVVNQNAQPRNNSRSSGPGQNSGPGSNVSNKRPEEVNHEQNRGPTFGDPRKSSEGATGNSNKAYQQGLKQITKIFSKTQHTSGFSAIEKQLERERTNNFSKSTANGGGARKRTHTPVSGYRSRSRHEEKFNSTINQSKMSIFEMHPNVEVSRTEYTGSIVPLLLDYSSQLQDMSEEQGYRRWKVSNFKEKSLLLENDVIQIGFKSTPLYQVEGFPALLKIVIFFGNKSDYTITNFEIDYEGDHTCQLYSNPRKADPTIEPGYQSKQELVVVPVEKVFNLISMRIKYMNNRTISRSHIFLPNTLLKFARFRKIPVQEFNLDYYRNKGNVYRTSPFLLSRNLSPAALRRYVNEFFELTDYQQFMNQREYSQYKLGCLVTVMNIEDFLVKIRVRPDLTVIVQVCVMDPNNESVPMAKQLLQALQFMLQRE